MAGLADADGTGKTAADWLADWQRRIDADERARQGEPVKMTRYICRRCGGRFERKEGREPPRHCPACGFSGWLDPKANITPLRWKKKRKAGGRVGNR